MIGYEDLASATTTLFNLAKRAERLVRRRVVPCCVAWAALPPRADAGWCGTRPFKSRGFLRLYRGICSGDAFREPSVHRSIECVRVLHLLTACPCGGASKRAPSAMPTSVKARCGSPIAYGGLRIRSSQSRPGRCGDQEHIPGRTSCRPDHADGGPTPRNHYAAGRAIHAPLAKAVNCP